MYRSGIRIAIRVAQRRANRSEKSRRSRKIQRKEILKESMSIMSDKQKKHAGYSLIFDRLLKKSRGTKVEYRNNSCTKSNERVKEWINLAS